MVWSVGRAVLVGPSKAPGRILITSEICLWGQRLGCRAQRSIWRCPVTLLCLLTALAGACSCFAGSAANVRKPNRYSMIDAPVSTTLHAADRTVRQLDFPFAIGWASLPIYFAEPSAERLDECTPLQIAVGVVIVARYWASFSTRLPSDHSQPHTVSAFDGWRDARVDTRSSNEKTAARVTRYRAWREQPELLAAPLSRFAQRTFIAGVLPNTHENLAAWIANPQNSRPKDCDAGSGCHSEVTRRTPPPTWRVAIGKPR